MIQLERLIELVEQKAIIYELTYGKIRKVDLSNPTEISKKSAYIRISNPFCIQRHYMDKLFETEAEAMWQNNIPAERTEKFEPLYYDNIDQNYCYDYRFFTGNRHEYMIRISGKDLILFWLNCGHKEYYKNTKENYEKLVEKCRKMFLGEDNGTTTI